MTQKRAGLVHFGPETWYRAFKTLCYVDCWSAPVAYILASICWALSRSCEKRLLAWPCLSVCLLVRPSVRVEQPGFHWGNFHEISYMGILRNSASTGGIFKKFRIWIFYETRLPLEAFSRNFVSGYFTKIGFHWRDFHEISYLGILRNSDSTGGILMKFRICVFCETRLPLGGIFMKFHIWVFYETRLPLEGFSWNFISGYFTKICFHRRDFHEILYLDILRNSASTGGIFMKFHIWLFNQTQIPLEGF